MCGAAGTITILLGGSFLPHSPCFLPDEGNSVSVILSIPQFYSSPEMEWHVTLTYLGRYCTCAALRICLPSWESVTYKKKNNNNQVIYTLPLSRNSPCLWPGKPANWKMLIWKHILFSPQSYSFHPSSYKTRGVFCSSHLVLPFKFQILLNLGEKEADNWALFRVH